MSIQRALLTSCAVVVVGACGADSNAPVPGDIAGGWVFRERLVGPLRTCDDTARVRVVQQSARFTVTGAQTGVCRGSAGETTPNPGAVAVVDGHISGGSAVSFSFGACTYTGTISNGDDALDGTVRCLGNSPATGTWRMTRTDIEPPSVTAPALSREVSHGDTITVAVSASDSALAVIGVSIVFTPVNFVVECPRILPPAVMSAAVGGTAAEAAFRAEVPNCAGDAQVIAFAVDTAGNRAEDVHHPSLIVLPESQVNGSFDDSLYTVGDTAEISVAATNPRGLSWVGYHWGNPNPVSRDSIAVSGTSAAHHFALPLPGVGPHTHVTVQAFARHRLGWLSKSQEHVSSRVTDAVRLPLERLTLPGSARDVAYAAGTNRVFISGPGHEEVWEVGLAPLALRARHAIDGPAASLDLSRSEDSLIVALRGQLTLAVVRVSTGSVENLALTPPDTISIHDARQVRIVANDRALVLVASGSSGYVTQLDLTTGTQLYRVPWYGYGTLERTPDRSRLLLIDGGSPVGDQLYLAASDSFLPPQSGVVRLFGTEGQISADDLAAHWVVGCQLFTADMGAIRLFSDPTLGPGPTALTRDGTRAYCTRNDGVLEFDVATGNLLRAIWLPSHPELLEALPGNRLLAVSGTTLYLLTLP
jgi:hypothetical protein